MRKNLHAGKFIVLEGIEGSGKTVQTRMLAERIALEGLDVLATREPTGEFPFGRFARSVYVADSPDSAVRKELSVFLKTKEFKQTLKDANRTKRFYIKKFQNAVVDIAVLLQIAITLDRHDHLQKMIMPALKKGVHVISDRYFLSTPAYSAANGHKWQPFLKMQFDILGKDFIPPNLTILLSVPVAVGLKRTLQKQEDRREYFDQTERQERIKRAYEELLQKPQVRNNCRCLEINGTQAPTVIHEKIWAAVYPLLK